MATKKLKPAATAAKKTDTAKKAKPAAAAKRNVAFVLKDLPGKTVALAGSFNNWQPTKLMIDKEGDGTYRCLIQLEPGEYQYKFVVDGEWRSDCENPNWVVNEFGSFNSIIKIESK